MEITSLGRFGESYSGNTNLEVKPEDLSRSGDKSNNEDV